MIEIPIRGRQIIDDVITVGEPVMAQTGEATGSGWRRRPGTKCTGNKFNNLRVVECGGRAFQANDSSCTNNIINSGQFLDNAQGGLSQPVADPVTARNLTVKPLRPVLP